MKSLFGLLLTIVSFSTSAQTSEETAIKETINQLFTGMRTSDTALISRSFASTAILQTIVNRDGTVQVRVDELATFIKSVGTPRKEILDERIQFGTILIDGPMATVWTPYKFYIGETFSHCGVNSFQLVKLATGWKIQSIIDTRRKENCQ